MLYFTGTELNSQIARAVFINESTYSNRNRKENNFSFLCHLTKPYFYLFVSLWFLPYDVFIQCCCFLVVLNQTKFCMLSADLADLHV